MRKFKITYRANSYLMLLGAAAVSTMISVALYNQTKDIMETKLKERLVAIVSTATLVFNEKDIESVKNEDAVGTATYGRLVGYLQGVRNTNKNVRFAYLLRPTESPDIFTFIADADSLDPSAEIDLNQDGVIDDEDALATPGDEYDVSEVPAIRDEATKYATTDAEPVMDQWGMTLSAYAPIKSQGVTIAVLGIDVDVSDYIALISATFVPFVLFIIFLLFLLALLTVRLVKIWGSRVELLQELDRQKDELLGIVAHQLAKPITAIRWDLESLLDGDLGALTDKQQEEAKTMRSQAINLADLVSMILDVSRIQLGKIKLEPQPLDMNEFFKDILDVIEPSVKQKKLNFIKDMPKSLPTVLLDKRYTRMTIENLMTNAVKYTPDGGKVELRVNIINGMMHGSVTDTGCGIPKADQGKIFGKMYRATNVRNTVDGNGFGLYVAKGAIEGQGGKIWFESTEGKGTTFHFEIPMIEPPKKSA